MVQSIEQRIDRVINNLLPTAPLAGKFGVPKTLADRLAYYRAPGISIAVINDFEIEWARGFGVCETGTTREVTPEILFQAASISKPVFALAVMRLVQEGRLNLDEDVNTYLTSWRVPAIADWQPRITLRQLLSHTAGLTVHGFPGYPNSAQLPTTVQILNGELPANTDRVEVDLIPGLHFRYSGGGTTIAQQVVVDVLGKPFPAIVRELVLDPLSMTDSTYEQPLPIDWLSRAATAHSRSGIPLEGKHHVYPEMAAAGLWTTAADLAKVGVALMRILRGSTPAIWSKETIEEMLRPQQPEQSQETNEAFAGLGFFAAGTSEGFHFFHNGLNEGFVSFMRFYPHLGKGAVIMLNTERFDLIEAVMRSIALEYEWPDVLPLEKTIVTLSQIDIYSGLYLTQSGLQFKVIGRDGNLFLQCDRQPPLQLFPTSGLEFFTKAVNTSICFKKDDTGSIVSMTLGQVDRQIKAKKQR
jgi:CubicO group peptidase (beta-lactamase class C family)